jgi:dinuclear metal center YbgI/SA1388 family protein
MKLHMSTSLATIIQALEQLAPPVYQENYDNSGLQLGDPAMAVRGVLVSLDITETVVDEAIQKDCNVVVAHHPLLFNGIKRLTPDNWIARTLLKAAASGIALYAIHTNLDNMLHGVNNTIADQLQLQNRRILSPKSAILFKLITFVPQKDAADLLSALFEAGAGQLGKYDQASFSSQGVGTFRPLAGANPSIGSLNQQEKVDEMRLELLVDQDKIGPVLRTLLSQHPYEEVAYDLIPLHNRHQEIGSGLVGDLAAPMAVMDFLELLKNRFGGGIRYTQTSKKSVQRIALCGGSGSFLLEKAKAEKADVFVTADFKYHQFFDADNRLIIADLGHFESEQFTIPLLANYLSEKFTNFATLTTETRTNPVNYL